MYKSTGLDHANVDRTQLQLQTNVAYIYIYIYAFSRRFYPKRLTFICHCTINNIETCCLLTVAYLLVFEFLSLLKVHFIDKHSLYTV